MKRALFVALAALAMTAQTRTPFRVATNSSSGSLIQPSDLSCTGGFLTPGVGQGFAGGNYPVAMRYDTGTRQYFVMDGVNEHVISFREPTLVSCGTAFSGMNRATAEFDWGAPTFAAGNSAGGDAVPGFNAGGVMGSHFDPNGHLGIGWSGNYSIVGSHNSWTTLALNNGGHTMTSDGCWGFGSPLTQPYPAGGVTTIPAAFVAANLPTGHNYGVMGGWPFATVGAGISEGPTLYAIGTPTPNACTASMDTFISSGATLEQFSAGGTGPACTDNVTFYGMGCTPPITTISPPYPKQIAYTNYSRETYSSDWEPYPVGAPTHGWVGFLTFGAFDWYEDGVKHGIVSVFATPEGWINETVTSSTSATSFVASATSTHDGLNMNVGDIISVQTCTVGSDPGCNGDQSHFSSQLQIASINTSTHAITVNIISQDQSTGNHFPVPGGPVLFGCFYSFGTPTCSRWEMRMQVDDPDDLALVAAGSKQPYAVVATYDQEIDQTLLTGYGSPTAGNGVHLNSQQAPGVSSVIADTTGHNLIVVLPFVQNPTFLIGDAILVWHINESSPKPSPSLAARALAWTELVGSAGLTLAVGLTLLGGRRRRMR